MSNYLVDIVAMLQSSIYDYVVYTIIYILIWSASAYLIFEIAQWLNLAKWDNHVLKTKPHHCMSGLC